MRERRRFVGGARKRRPRDRLFSRRRRERRERRREKGFAAGKPPLALRGARGHVSASPRRRVRAGQVPPRRALARGGRQRAGFGGEEGGGDFLAAPRVVRVGHVRRSAPLGGVVRAADVRRAARRGGVRRRVRRAEERLSGERLSGASLDRLSIVSFFVVFARGGREGTERGDVGEREPTRTRASEKDGRDGGERRRTARRTGKTVREPRSFRRLLFEESGRERAFVERQKRKERRIARRRRAPKARGDDETDDARRAKGARGGARGGVAFEI